MFAVVSLNIEYRKPARLDDQLLITCEPKVEGAATIVFAQQIHRSGGGSQAAYGAASLLVQASARVACLDARTLRPKRLPAFLADDMPAAAGPRSNIKEPS